MKNLNSVKNSKCHFYIKSPDTKILINIYIPLLFKIAAYSRYQFEGQLTKYFFSSK